MLEVRPFSPNDRLFREMQQRGETPDPERERRIAGILAAVRTGGTQALKERLREKLAFDAPHVSLRITEEEMAEARTSVSERFLTSLSLARVNIRRFHEYQRRHGYVHDESEGVRILRVTRPLRRIGICCGGSFMSLAMHAVTAQVAGVREIAAAVPCRSDGSVDPRLLATAKSLGIGELYRLSGAEAVAAMAYGTESTAKVDKIAGSGDADIRLAKRLIGGAVGVSGDLGLGELAVVADESANAKFIAGDLIAQAELGGGLLVLLTTDRLLAEAVRIEIDRLTGELPNAAEVRRILERYCAIWLFPHLDAAIDAVNQLAPARLNLMTRNNGEYVSDVETAGGVFLGPWSADTIGDFFSGVNSFLPTGGRARHASSLSVDDFVREMSVVEYGPDRLLMTGRHLTALAEEENLPAHAQAVRNRMELLKLTVD